MKNSNELSQQVENPTPHADKILSDQWSGTKGNLLAPLVLAALLATSPILSGESKGEDIPDCTIAGSVVGDPVVNELTKILTTVIRSSNIIPDITKVSITGPGATGETYVTFKPEEFVSSTSDTQLVFTVPGEDMVLYKAFYATGTVACTQSIPIFVGNSESATPTPAVTPTPTSDNKVYLPLIKR